MSDSNMQYVTSTSFLLVTYAKYLTSSHKVVNCGGKIISPKRLRVIAKKQVWISPHDWSDHMSVTTVLLLLLLLPLLHKSDTIKFYSPWFLISLLWDLVLGGLPLGGQPIEDVIHGGVWSTVSTKDTPQGFITAVHFQTPGKDPVSCWLQYHELSIPKPKHLGGGSGGWARPAWSVPGSTVWFRAIRAVHIHQCPTCGRSDLSSTFIRAALVG